MKPKFIIRKFKIRNKKINKFLKDKRVKPVIDFFDHHHTLGITAFAFTIIALSLFITFAITTPSQLMTKAYFPEGCGVPTVPRGKTCTTSWIITRDQNNCRVFTCQP